MSFPTHSHSLYIKDYWQDTLNMDPTKDYFKDTLGGI